jgi:integrase
VARRRQKGTGAVRKLPSGRWQARVANGDGQLVSLGSFSTKTDAAHALRISLGDQARGDWVDPRAGQLTLRDYACDWLEHRPIRPRTRELYESLLRNHILPTFGDLALVDITSRHVRHWHSRMLTAPKPGAVTVAKTYRLMRTILVTAIEDGLIARNPCAIKGAGVEHSPERPVASIEQVYAIADTVDPRYRMLILLATFTSLRFGELAALTRRRIDLDTGLITVAESANELNNGTRIVDQPKTHAGRRVVAVPPLLMGDLRHHLEHYAASGRDGVVFTGPLGAPLRRSNWSKNWRRAIDGLDLAHLHFHDLRHTGNTLAASTGASTKELMNRMGHSSSRAALHYQHATMERELVIAQRLSDLVAVARQ